MRGGDQKAAVSIRLIIAWRQAIELGIAGQLCDRIVAERDVPDRLFIRLYETNNLKYNLRMLTKRQRQCLSLSSFGFDHEEIAGFLGIAKETVEFHLSKIRLRLNAKNTSEAVAIAYRMKEIR